uniref:Uncharacterized protein n=1 Tax=Arundo donax TaxID=35708 RepID=A0A0A9C334_ARUDO
MLRLSVEAGGFSGFQYFSLNDKKNADDRYQQIQLQLGAVVVKVPS